MMIFFRPPKIQKLLFPKFQWKIDTSEKVIYLTFDDGPTEEVTAYVLDLLDQYNAKATFFLIGQKVKKESELAKRMVRCGHGIGNHTSTHPSGWTLNPANYMEEVAECDRELAAYAIETNLFRPPYGRVTFAQYKNLVKRKRVIMWSMLSWDFSEKLNVDRALRHLKKAQRGDILVFHDTIKAYSNLKKLLPETLEYFANQGFQFKKI